MVARLKTPVTPSTVGRIVMNSEPEVDTNPDLLTPECFFCGEEHIGVTNNAVMVLKGQWFPSVEFDAPIFLLDPDTKLRVIQLPNGQLAVASDAFGHPTRHGHDECLEGLLDESLEEEQDDETDEEYEGPACLFDPYEE